MPMHLGLLLGHLDEADSAFISFICSTVRHSVSRSRGLATTYARQRVRERAVAPGFVRRGTERAPSGCSGGQVFLNVAVYFDVAVTTMVWIAGLPSDQDKN
jgi:hypothetical protein